MTKPNIEELIERLRDNGTACKCNARCSGECGCSAIWAEDFTSDAANALQSQAERIAELEAEVNRLQREVVNRNQRALDGDKAVAILASALAREDTLRAQLAEIEKQEPVAWLHTGRMGGTQAFTNEPPPRLKTECQPLFTRPMPAQDVTELVERKPIFTTGHCKEKQKPGGCQLHNLQCGYPKCDRGPTIDLGRYAGTYGGYIKKEQP